MTVSSSARLEDAGSCTRTTPRSARTRLGAGQGKPSHVSLERALGSTAPLDLTQGAVGVNLTLEAGEEACASGSSVLRRVAPRVQRVGADAGAHDTRFRCVVLAGAHGTASFCRRAAHVRQPGTIPTTLGGIDTQGRRCARASG